MASKVASLEGENVVYQTEPTLGKRASMELIFSFLRLGDASAKEIYSFARKWGALGIDPHIRGRSDEVILWAESVSVWRNLAARLGALLRITNAINSGSGGSTEDWILTGAIDARPTEMSPRERHLKLQVQVNGMAQQFGLQPYLDWENSEWRMVMHSRRPLSNVPAILALQVMILIADLAGHVTCSTCHFPYAPERMPPNGRGNYCPKCRRDGKMWRALKQKQRRRKHGKETRTE